MKFNKFILFASLSVCILPIILALSFKKMIDNSKEQSTEYFSILNKKPEFMTIYTNLSMYHVDIDNLVIQEENWDGYMEFDTYRALADSLEIMTATDVNISTSIPQDCWVNSQTFLGDTILEVVTWEYDHRIIIGTVEYTEDMGWTYYPNCKIF